MKRGGARKMMSEFSLPRSCRVPEWEAWKRRQIENTLHMFDFDHDHVWYSSMYTNTPLVTEF